MLRSDSLSSVSSEPVGSPSDDVTESLDWILELVGSDPLILVTSCLMNSSPIVIDVKLHSQREVVDLVQHDVSALLHEFGSLGVDLTSKCIHSSDVCILVLHHSPPLN